ncbi:MAG TPA: hypothetical protein VNX68_06330 [Nitrosopumilaceae archaeon]|jgi:hypothetical protein|nr:hypothetical protein [Nitrosopumilaceae archaeon]
MKKQIKQKLFEGLPVIDAEESITLHVTPIDVKFANKKDPKSCAAAKAGQRELKRDVRVFISRTYVKEKDHWVRYKTPMSAQKEIVSFDRGASFEPGEYTIKPFSQSDRLGAYKPTDENHRNRKGNGIRKKLHYTGMIRERSKYDLSIKDKKGNK